MDPAALLGLCLLLGREHYPDIAPSGVRCPMIASNLVVSRSPISRGWIGDLQSASAREGIGRVAFAEAGDQGDSGLAAVVYTILNRLEDGRWGDRIDRVLNARGQFEPVTRAGGDWRALPAITSLGQARIDTILNLALEGRLPDLTHGARFFQNPAIVKSRVFAGQAPADLVDFGGATPSAVIGAHRFYVTIKQGGGALKGGRFEGAGRVKGAGSEALFVGGDATQSGRLQRGEEHATSPSPSGDPSHALFVDRSGQARADPLADQR